MVKKGAEFALGLELVFGSGLFGSGLELGGGSILAGGGCVSIGFGKFSGGDGNLRSGLKLFAPAINCCDDRFVVETEFRSTMRDTCSVVVAASAVDLLASSPVIRPPAAKILSHFDDLSGSGGNSIFCLHDRFSADSLELDNSYPVALLSIKYPQKSKKTATKGKL